MKIHDGKYELLDELKADCSKCSGLCCTALFFAKSDGFPDNKQAGIPCRNLQEDFCCRIHGELGQRKMKGCIGYDCFGSGQHVTQILYKGRTWKSNKEQQDEIFQVFIRMFQLYQIRFYLAEAMTLLPARKEWNQVGMLLDENEKMCCSDPEEILGIDIEQYRSRVNLTLKRVCDLVLSCSKDTHRKCPSDFMGKNFAGKDLSCLDLNMKLLIAADFSQCAFHGTLFLGADTRDADFRGADLSQAVFLSQGQVNAAKGSRDTKLPDYLNYPITWK